MVQRTAIGAAIARTRRSRRMIDSSGQERVMSQTDLAQAIGMSQPTISDFEKGRRDIGLDQLQAIAVALGTDVLSILGDAAAPEHEPVAA